MDKKRKRVGTNVYINLEQEDITYFKEYAKSKNRSMAQQITSMIRAIIKKKRDTEKDK